MVTIKKYENRRMYDSRASRYVNLDDVAELVRQGEAIEVVDAKTGEDLTRHVLTQIIVEGARDKDSGVPIDLLRQLIMASGRAQQEMMSRYFRSILDLYQRAQADLRQSFTDARHNALHPMDALQRYIENPAETMRPWMFPWLRHGHDEDPGKETPEEPAVAAQSQRGEELAELRRRLDVLERKLSNGSPSDGH